MTQCSSDIRNAASPSDKPASVCQKASNAGPSVEFVIAIAARVASNSRMPAEGAQRAKPSAADRTRWPRDPSSASENARSSHNPSYLRPLMKNVGVMKTPLARALSMSASTLAAARARAAAVSGVPSTSPKPSATARMSSCVSVSDRVISATCASQNRSSSGADSASSADARARSAWIGRCRKT